jgi:phage shock protein PspC (stress-responsive transcriptional regulator)
MKKTITINLAGVVFHIEEDAYEILKKYLGSVKQYFLNVEGGVEIQGDIEARIAELFSELLTESKQAITIEDVQTIIKQLGSVEDMMNDDDVPLDKNAQNEKEQKSENGPQSDSQRRLARDSSNAIVAGVLSGLAAYFGVNPLWVRLLVVALFFGIAFFPAVSGFILVSYIILWIAMPADPSLENTGKFKKFLRSRKNQMVAGVSGGLGAFFNVDPTIVRILFLVSTFFAGSGLILYLVLWAITPEAKSLTDEIQMEGNPVTLNSIEDQIRKNVIMEDKNAQNTVIKVVSLPFKIIAMVVAALGPLVKFAFDAVRVFLAIIVLILGGSFLFAIIILAGAGLGFIEPTTYNIQTGGFPLGRVASEISPLMVFFAAITALVPVISILLLSFSLMTRRNLMRPLVALVLVGLFFTGLAGSAVTIIPFAQKFKEEGSFIETVDYKLKSEMVTLSLNQLDEETNGFYPLELQIKGWEDSTFKLTKRFEAQGKTRKEASANARLATYNIVRQDSSLIFDSDLVIDPNIPYRAQRLVMKLYVPYDQKFQMDPALHDMIKHTLYPNGYDVSQLEGNIWVFGKKGLKCLTCKENSSASESESNQNEDDEEFD